MWLYSSVVLNKGLCCDRPFIPAPKNGPLLGLIHPYAASFPTSAPTTQPFWSLPDAVTIEVKTIQSGWKLTVDVDYLYNVFSGR